MRRYADAVAAADTIECMVTPGGLEARASAYGVEVAQLPPPDGLLTPGDTYTSTSGCAKGDFVVETSATGQLNPGGSDGTSPLVMGVIIGLVLIIAALIAYFVVRRSQMMRLERAAFLESELREDRTRGRL